MTKTREMGGHHLVDFRVRSRIKAVVFGPVVHPRSLAHSWRRHARGGVGACGAAQHNYIDGRQTSPGEGTPFGGSVDWAGVALSMVAPTEDVFVGPASMYRR